MGTILFMRRPQPADFAGEHCQRSEHADPKELQVFGLLFH